jgi:hypothetical protein
MLLGEDFFGKIVLLLIAALVTGYAVPMILKRVDERKLKAQKIFEADLTRQQKVIDAQAQLLDNLSQLLWTFQLSAIEVTYYHGRNDSALYDKALHKYEENAGNVLGKVRAEISKALRLTSAETYTELKELYYDGLLTLDIRLRDLIEGQANDWVEFNQYAVYEFADRVDNVLRNLADELRLDRRTNAGAPSTSSSG